MLPCALPRPGTTALSQCSAQPDPPAHSRLGCRRRSSREEPLSSTPAHFSLADKRPSANRLQCQLLAGVDHIGGVRTVPGEDIAVLLPGLHFVCNDQHVLYRKRTFQKQRPQMPVPALHAALRLDVFSTSGRNCVVQRTPGRQCHWQPIVKTLHERKKSSCGTSCPLQTGAEEVHRSVHRWDLVSALARRSSIQSVRTFLANDGTFVCLSAAVAEKNTFSQPARFSHSFLLCLPVHGSTRLSCAAWCNLPAHCLYPTPRCSSQQSCRCRCQEVDIGLSVFIHRDSPAVVDDTEPSVCSPPDWFIALVLSFSSISFILPPVQRKISVRKSISSPIGQPVTITSCRPDTG